MEDLLNLMRCPRYGAAYKEITRVMGDYFKGGSWLDRIIGPQKTLARIRAAKGLISEDEPVLARLPDIRRFERQIERYEKFFTRQL